MHKKSSAGTGTYSIIFGVAFVWFTTHFGGGFAPVPDLQLLCTVRHLVSDHACTCHAL